MMMTLTLFSVLLYDKYSGQHGGKKVYENVPERKRYQQSIVQKNADNVLGQEM